MQKREIQQFQKTVLGFYTQNKRDLPWRPSTKRKVTPYEILVSEYMLQQTQVHRIVPKFLAFIKKFPTLEFLAHASDKEVLSLWSGLGYNRRALYLRNTARIIVENYNGIVPKETTVLKTFPGIGAYMASVLPVFIYNQREVLIETNIRTIFIHHFFTDTDNILDTAILELIEKTLPEKNPRDWYYALMDYGTYLKKEKKVKNTQSAHYIKQKPFKGSLRYVRGTLLKQLVTKKIEKEDVYDFFPEYTSREVEKVCADLLKEGLIKETKKYFYL